MIRTRNCIYTVIDMKNITFLSRFTLSNSIIWMVKLLLFIVTCGTVCYRISVRNSQDSSLRKSRSSITLDYQVQSPPKLDNTYKRFYSTTCIWRYHLSHFAKCFRHQRVNSSIKLICEIKAYMHTNAHNYECLGFSRQQPWATLHIQSAPISGYIRILWKKLKAW